MIEYSWFIRLFTCAGAADVLFNQQMSHMSEEDRARVFNEANDIVYVYSLCAHLRAFLIFLRVAEVKKREAALSQPSQPAYYRKSEHFQAIMLHPTGDEHIRQQEAKGLVGRTVRYTDSNGVVKTISILDFGRSYHRGEFFSVFDEGSALDISIVEMREILDAEI